MPKKVAAPRLLMPWDTETTGLPLHDKAPLAKQPKCIEIGALLLDANGNEVAALDQLINPGEPLTDEIIRITGITDDRLRGQPTFAEFLPTIAEFFGRASTMVAHNLSFDRSIITFELRRIGPAAVDSFPWPKGAICTVEATIEDWGRRPKLKELYASLLGKSLDQKHRALDDVRALAEVVAALGIEP